jgi:xylulokinase
MSATARAMGSGPLVLGLDVGTQGTKALLLDPESGAVVARAGKSYGLLPDLPPGAAEQHPETWIEAVRDATRAVLDRAARGRIAAVGVSGQQHGLVVLDEQLAVVRPAKLWCDTSTSAEASELSRLLERPVPTGYTASKILWLSRHEPEAWGRVRHVLLPHDYVNLRLTGRLAMEAGDASGTGLFDPLARRFVDEDELRAVDERLPLLLPPLIDPGTPVGTLTADGAALLGLREGLPVAAGSGDNMCSALGSGATRAGVVVVSLGTSGTVFTHSERPVVDPAGLIAPFCDATGGWLPLLCVMNCTNVTEEVCAAFAPAAVGARGGVGAAAAGAAAATTADELAALTRAARDVPPGCDGLLWLPYLHGERVPDLPSARGVLAGLSPGSLSPGTLFRAALEGVCLNLGWGVERLRALGVTVDAVRVVGGGAQNPLWRAILADVLDAPVTRLLEPESAALGAAIDAAWTLRRISGDTVSADEVGAPCIALADEVDEPDRARVAVYGALAERYRRLAERHFDVR